MSPEILMLGGGALATHAAAFGVGILYGRKHPGAATLAADAATDLQKSEMVVQHAVSQVKQDATKL